MKRVIIPVILLLGGATIFAVRSGIFVQPVVSRAHSPAVTVAVAKHLGSYETTSGVLDSLKGILAEHFVKGGAVVSLFFDDPTKVAEPMRRTMAGQVVTKDQMEQMDQMKLVYDWVEVPACSSLVSTVPFISTTAYRLSRERVYRLFRKETGGVLTAPLIEILDPTTRQIRFVMPLTLEPKRFEEWWSGKHREREILQQMLEGSFSDTTGLAETMQKVNDEMVARMRKENAERKPLADSAKGAQ